VWGPVSDNYLTREPPRGPQHRSVPGQWQQYQLGQLLGAFLQVHHAVTVLCSDSSTAAAAAAAAAATAAAPAPATAAHVSNSATTSSSSSYISLAYMFDALGSCSSRLQDFNSRWPDLQGAVQLAKEQDPPAPSASASCEGSSSSQQDLDAGQLCADALRHCRAVAAVAPLPRVCNHLGCENLAGSSEAAAAAKVCGGCGAGYCSAACQAADRRRHKHACRRMMAAGQMCK
jgi:hypothetical protein